MATGGGGDDSEWQKLPCDEKVQHKVLENLIEICRDSHLIDHLCLVLGVESAYDWL